MRLRSRVDKLEQHKRSPKIIVVASQAEADTISDRGDNVLVVITGICASVGSEVEVDMSDVPQRVDEFGTSSELCPARQENQYYD